MKNEPELNSHEIKWKRQLESKEFEFQESYWEQLNAIRKGHKKRPPYNLLLSLIGLIGTVTLVYSYFGRDLTSKTQHDKSSEQPTLVVSYATNQSDLTELETQNHAEEKSAVRTTNQNESRTVTSAIRITGTNKTQLKTIPQSNNTQVQSNYANPKPQIVKSNFENTLHEESTGLSPQNDLEQNLNYAHRITEYISFDSKIYSRLSYTGYDCDTCLRHVNDQIRYAQKNFEGDWEFGIGSTITVNGMEPILQPGWDFGVGYTMAIHQNWFASAGLIYSRLYTTLPDVSYMGQTYQFGVTTVSETHQTRFLDYVLVPISMGYTLNKSHSVSAGATFCYLTQAGTDIRKTYTGENNRVENQTVTGTYSYMNETDVWMHATYRYSITPSFGIAGTFQYGLQDVIHGNAGTERNIGLRLMLLYRFIK